MCVSVCSLISHFSYLMSVVSQTAGPISREPRHDSDLRRLVAGGCDSEQGREEGEGEERRGGQGGRGERVGTEGGGGCRPWEAVSPLALGSRDEQLAMNTCVAATRSTHTDADTHTLADAQEQLKIAKQRPFTTSANYLAESRPGSRIRVVPAVGLDRRMALIEVES